MGLDDKQIIYFPFTMRMLVTSPMFPPQALKFK